MVCLCKYHNSITNLFSPAFQQLKSIGSGICYPLENFKNAKHCVVNTLDFKKDIESFEDEGLKKAMHLQSHIIKRSQIGFHWKLTCG